MGPSTIADPHEAKGLRAGYHWAYAGCPGLGTSDLMRAPYERARDLSHWPDRKVPDGLVRSTEGVGSVNPKTLGAKHAQETYALRCELGPRAYAELTGTRIGPKPVAKPKVVVRMEAVATIRRRADGGAAVVLSDHEMMVALGIKPVGYLD